MKVHPEGGYVEGLVKKVLAFGWKHFPSINFVGLHHLSSNLTSGTSMRGIAGLILMKNGFNCFNFYSIDLEGKRRYHDNTFPKHYCSLFQGALDPQCIS